MEDCDQCRADRDPEQQVLDLTIEEPPIEDVIELVFAQE